MNRSIPISASRTDAPVPPPDSRQPRHGSATGLVSALQVCRHGHEDGLLKTTPLLSSSGIGWHGVALEVHHAPACFIPEHEHPVHFLQLQLKGPASFDLKTGKHTSRHIAERGTIFFCPQGTRDQQYWQTPTERLAVALDPAFVASTLEDTASLQSYSFAERWDLRDSHIERIMLALLADVEEQSPAGRLYGESLGTALSVYLLKRYGTRPLRACSARGGLPVYRLRRVLDYIAANLGEDLSLQDLAAVAGASSHYFAHLFKRSTGMTPHHYVLTQRIERAKKLLAGSSMTVLQVATETGFVDQSHFTKVFRRIAGATPRTFRANI
jgi:AraC family transcriptional regulator